MNQEFSEQHEPEFSELPSEAKSWAALCHIAGFLGAGIPLLGHIVGPLIIWLLKRDDHPFIDEQGKEAINFQLSMVIYAAIISPTLCIVIGIPLLIALFLADKILMIIAAIKASNGEPYRYPLTLRLLK